MKLIHEFPEGEVIVSMCNHNDNVVIATTARVYLMDDKGLVVPIVFKGKDDE